MCSKLPFGCLHAAGTETYFDHVTGSQFNSSDDDAAEPSASRLGNLAALVTLAIAAMNLVV
jgi:hypothetical protein